MARIEKTVFISYRRTNFPWALAIYQDLTQHGYDVFFDFNSIPAGDFETVILENVRARAHFLVLLTPSALERCSEAGDWLRREIETALDEKRNIIPLMLEGFSFSTPAIADQLTGKLALLRKYQAVGVPAEYVFAAMEKLRTYLNVALDTVSHPASPPAQEAAKEQKIAAKAAPIVRAEALIAQAYFERGFSAVDPDEKIRFYTEGIRLLPNYADAYINRGVARKAKGDLEGALADYDEAIRLKPDDALAYSNRGNARRDKANIEDALADYGEAIRLKPDYADAYINRGVARKAKGDLEGALADYDEAIRLKPDDALAYSNRGNARLAKGDIEGALADYGEAVRLMPDDPVAYSNRGNARCDKGDIEGALADYDEAIRLKPDYANAYYNRAQLKKNRPEHRAAIADFQKYLDLGGGESEGDQVEVEEFIRDLKAKL
ncbi:toll/interleukin-1 receptor domain-containing protein [Alloacidobacterium sp.]|uniref:toll/interleukin-1 receptor domain-containing protein n=1 Tax=Alloacidobacterium sp. TaxID=2951999 RepID=UPI002D4D217D|nr:tetratricopeptide repeat protein [Alloacidobacterium sp.]HYK36867.1 tetratricopeptide repeat protein [Alloacidobacterium sp.]